VYFLIFGSKQLTNQLNVHVYKIYIEIEEENSY